MVRVGVRRGVAAGLAAALALSAAPAFAQAASDLFGTCFVRQSPNAAPAYRVASIAVLFQGFGDDLLASVAYRLRYGTAFGISGDCSEPADGGYLCHACANSDCAGGGESPSQSDQDANANEKHPVADDQQEYALSVGAKRDTDAHLTRAAGDRERQYAVDPNDRQQEQCSQHPTSQDASGRPLSRLSGLLLHDMLL